MQPILMHLNKGRIMNVTAKKTASADIPTYGNKPKKPGLYLGLFHGRDSQVEPMSDWGFDGPTIGPLKWCHTTYAFDIKIELENSVDAVRYFGVQQVNCLLEMNGDLLVYGGVFYGDWTVYYVGPDDCERPVDTFRPTTRFSDLLAHRKFLI